MIQDGDSISFDLEEGTVHADVDFSNRIPMTLKTKHQRGYLADFAAVTAQADQGCVSNWLTGE